MKLIREEIQDVQYLVETAKDGSKNHFKIGRAHV